MLRDISINSHHVFNHFSQIPLQVAKKKIEVGGVTGIFMIYFHYQINGKAVRNEFCGKFKNDQKRTACDTGAVG